MISAEFKAAVDSKNLLRTRIMLKDSMVVDPTMEQFDERFLYARKKLHDLLMPHDGAVLENDRSKWTTQLLSMEMVQLINNFSQERLSHARQMVKVIYAADAQRIAEKCRSSALTKQSKSRAFNLMSGASSQISPEKRKRLIQEIYQYGKEIERLMQKIDFQGRKFYPSDIDGLENAANALSKKIQTYKKIKGVK